MKNDIIILNDKTIIADRFKQNLTSRVYRFLRDLEYQYPGFRVWFFKKVVAGLYDGSRTIILASNSDELGGIAILKTSLEKKICTLRVRPTARYNGIGCFLFEKSLEILETRYPLFTVSSCRMNQFSSLVKKFDFRLEETLPEYYQPNMVEYVFNGHLIKTYSANKFEPYESNYASSLEFCTV